MNNTGSFVYLLLTTSAPSLTTSGICDESTEATEDYMGNKKEEKKKREYIKFVRENIDNIAIDIARGSGESLEALDEFLNIRTKRNKECFHEFLKANFDVIFADEDRNWQQTANLFRKATNLIYKHRRDDAQCYRGSILEN